MNQPFAKIYLILMASVLCPQISQAQKNVDSLFAIWSDTTNSAEVRVEAFFQRFDPVMNESTNPEAVRWGSGIIGVQQLAKQIGKTEYLPRFQVLESGVYIYFTKELDKGCALAQEAFSTAMEIKDRMTASGALTMLINVCGTIPESKLVEKFEEEISVGTEDNGTENRLIWLPLAEFHYFNSNLPKALVYLQKIIDTSEASNLEDSFYATALELAGAIHQMINNFREAERYLRQGLAIHKTIKDTLRISACYVDLSELYLRNDDPLLGMTYLDSALYITKNNWECEPCFNRARRIKAGLNNNLGKHQKALEELLSMQAYYQGIGRATNANRGKYFAELGRSYLGLGQYKNALAASEKGIELTFGHLVGAFDNYEILYQASKALGDYPNALGYYQNYVSAKDSIIELRNSQQVTKLELENLYEKKRLADSLNIEQQKLEQELALQSELSLQKTNRNIFIGLGIGALLLALGLYQRLRLIRKTEAALKEKNVIIEQEKEKAKASERAKHQFLANMSHEIRTPMNAVMGMTDILLRRSPKSEQLEYLEGIRQSSNSLLVIINDILDLSKIEAGKIELEEVPFAIDEVVKNVNTIMQFKVEEKGLELRAIVSGNLPLVLGDPVRLSQILVNLVGNAIKFTEKGLVSIAVEEKALNDQQVQLQFVVSDTGVGIGEDRLEKIFESFEQAYSDTTRKFGGTGLGLSISKKLVELQEGEIWVESEKGKGSQFYFTLTYPVCTAEKAAMMEEPKADLAAIANALTGVRILLVEDNVFNAMVAQEELEDAIEGAQVDVAENGAIAVEKVKTRHYDIILMDVQMPVMNGYEATRKIRLMNGEKPAIPIIAMTANVLKEEVDRCREEGMNDFIGKPFDTGELLQKMQALLTF